MMRCLYCDQEINKYSIYSLLIEEDRLCPKCRNSMIVNHRYVFIDSIKIEVLYDYDSLFKTLLIQYKELFDEALSGIFLYKYGDYIKLKYFNYSILYVPSSSKKLNERGFNHLKKIFESLKLREIKGLEMVEDISQVNKNLKERELMKNNYIYRGEKLKNVLIVDDVLTTGSSIVGVYRAIKPYAKSIKVLVLSKR